MLRIINKYRDGMKSAHRTHLVSILLRNYFEATFMKLILRLLRQREASGVARRCRKLSTEMHVLRFTPKIGRLQAFTQLLMHKIIVVEHTLRVHFIFRIELLKKQLNAVYHNNYRCRQIAVLVASVALVGKSCVKPDY